MTRSEPAARRRPVPRRTIVAAIMRKDIAEYRRDRLWVFLTVMVLVIVVALFWILPDDVDETITLGVAGLDAQLLAEAATAEDEGLRVLPFDSEAQLRAVVAGEETAWRSEGDTTVVTTTAATDDGPAGAEQVDVTVGLAFPADFAAAAASGDATGATVYVDAGVPEEIRTAMTSLVREIGFTLVGRDLPVEAPAGDVVVLGEDRAGAQASLRDGFRPLLVFLVLIMEMFVMASLIAKEIQDRTVTAVLVTPATTGDVLAAKSITGALSGFVQAVVVLVAIDALWPQPVLVLTLMLLGSVMVAGTAMIAGSTGRDFITTLFMGMAYMIPLIIPAFAALFPGTASAWIRALPSYPLVRGLIDVTTDGAGWRDTLPELGALVAWCVALFALGWVVLRRRVETR